MRGGKIVSLLMALLMLLCLSVPALAEGETEPAETATAAGETVQEAVAPEEPQTEGPQAEAPVEAVTEEAEDAAEPDEPDTPEPDTEVEPEDAEEPAPEEAEPAGTAPAGTVPGEEAGPEDPAEMEASGGAAADEIVLEQELPPAAVTIEPAVETIHATVSWGDMRFVLHEETADDGETHCRWTCEEDSNRITVTNVSDETPIYAEYRYTPTGAFDAPLYAFASAEDAEDAGREMNPKGVEIGEDGEERPRRDPKDLRDGFTGGAIPAGESETWYVMFADLPPRAALEGGVTVGRLSVSVSRAE